MQKFQPNLITDIESDGDADGQDQQCAPLSWRTEIERLTSWSLPCWQTDIPGQAALANPALAGIDRHMTAR
jgi:hypothetical protein